MANPLRTLLLLLAPACTGENHPTAKAPAEAPQDGRPETRPSLVIATLDTMRADRVGAYGYANARTPTLDGLATRGARFTRAYATVPLTTPSHSSMFTGLYPTRHGVRNNGDAILRDDATTLAEVLKEAGYKTGASVSAFVTTRVWNLDQGFDSYSDRIHSGDNPQNRWGQERQADEVVNDALAWLEQVQADEPFFLWVHFYDAHHPYRPPARMAELLPNRPYDGEIAFVDEQIGRLKAAIEAREQKDGVAWIAVGDHGEALNGEHGEFTHGTFVYDATMRIPFLVQPAKPLTSGVPVDDVAVSNVDVMPTALGLLGLPVPQDLDGADLSAWTRGETAAREGVYMESYSVAQRFGYHPEIAVAEGALKLMDTPNPRLFDLAADPKEEQNLVASRPDDVARLRKITEAVKARAVATGQSQAMAPEVLEQLAALGYVNAGTSLNGEDSAIDAKDRLETIRGLEKARVLGRSRETAEEAVALYRQILEAEPQIVEARLGLAQTLERLGRKEETEAVLREALARDASSTILHQNLAVTLARQGRFEEALNEAEAVLALVPGEETALQLKARFLGALGREHEALELAMASLEKNPASPGLQALAGMALARLGEMERAMPYLRDSLSDGVPRPGVHEVLGRLAAAAGDTDAAINHMRAELDAFPTSPRTRRVLSSLYMRARRWDEAADEYRTQVEARPKDVMLRRAYAQAVFNTGDYALSKEILAPALAEGSDNPHVLLLAANLEAKLGDRARAEEMAARAKELYALSKGDLPPEEQDLQDLLAPLNPESLQP